MIQIITSALLLVVACHSEAAGSSEIHYLRAEKPKEAKSSRMGLPLGAAYNPLLTGVNAVYLEAPFQNDSDTQIFFQGDPIVACKKIEGEISSASGVFYPPAPEYPGTTEDLGKALQIISEERVQFGVKSGGHTGSPGFSSTPGIQIALVRFNTVTYHQETHTADIGTGLVFDDLYKKLAETGDAVLGGRLSGIGVGGFVLGGGRLAPRIAMEPTFSTGYSWQTNQYGLAIDTVTEFELVSPSRETIIVNDESDPELFFGLKGGLNNFGNVWGGTVTYDSRYSQGLIAAYLKFTSNVTDPKAGIITTFNSFLSLVQLRSSSRHHDFQKIPSITDNTADQSFPENDLPGVRGVFDTVPLATFSHELMNVIYNETINVGRDIFANSGPLASYSFEPFLSDILSHNTMVSAYPPTRS
ncbi:hypothetical protein AMATHDRAFT_7626 [Amanita thiersii Skay4041]|uniref:FAD-binding PCMH-type domain-containing protein n=1 Tax=Amanita thiersii Skay4041 TaxID=703135 RepID=A0A2A9NB91_9AGAR|nr:hypothetical protein AMATHDRAFT_7626 [Amanita thiersii Skay4041]